MGIPINHGLNKNYTLTTFTDELHNSVGSSAFRLSQLLDSVGDNTGHDTFTQEDLVIRTASGGGGTLLVEGAGNDYVLSVEDETLSGLVTTAVGSTKTVYTKIQIINAAYQATDLYFSGKTVGDYTNADRINNITCIYESKSADETISDMPGFLIKAYTTGTNKKTVTLPTVAANDNLEIEFIKIDSGYGPLVIEGEGAETINGWDNIVLFNQHEKVRIKAINGAWYVIDNWKWHIESGYINTSDWTNRHLGIIDLNYNNLAGTFEQWEVITEETSGYRGIIINDTGAILRLVYIDDGAGGAGGFFTNGRQITGGSSGATADVNGNTKNVDSNFYHGINTSIEKINVQLYYSSDGAEANKIDLPWGPQSSTSSLGNQLLGIDVNNILPQTALNGIQYVQNAGGTLIALTTQDHYYNVIMEFRL